MRRRVALARAQMRVATTTPSPKRLSRTSFRGRSSIHKERGQAWPEVDDAEAEAELEVLPPHSLSSISLSISSPVVCISSAAPPHSFFPFFPAFFFLSNAFPLPNLPSPCQSVCVCLSLSLSLSLLFGQTSMSISVSVSPLEF